MAQVVTRRGLSELTAADQADGVKVLAGGPQEAERLVVMLACSNSISGSKFSSNHMNASNINSRVMISIV